MNGPVLTLEAVVVAALFLAGGLGPVWPRPLRRAWVPLCAVLAGLAGLLAALALLVPGPPASLQLPIGLPGAPFTLALDALSDAFLLLIGFAGALACGFAALLPPDEVLGRPGLPLALAGLLLALLAGDGFTLALGLALGGGGAWALLRPAPQERVSVAPLAVALLAAASMTVCCALLAPPGALPTFGAIRTAPSQPAHAIAAVLLGLGGLGALLGLVPLHRWMLPAHRALPSAGAALLSGGLVPVGLYALLRLVLDLGARAAPPAAVLPLLLFGIASLLLGGWRACRLEELDEAVAAGTLRQTGTAAIALALAVIGRAVDLPNLTVLALAAVMLLAAMQAVCAPLALLAAGAIRRQAGTRRLDRLGGLVHAMPLGSAALLVGLGGMAAVPTTPGFAVLYLSLHALLAAPRDGWWAPALLIGLALLLTLGGVLAAAATLRLVGIACLGRPRTPRVAGAEEVPKLPGRVLLLGMGATALLGLLPGPAVQFLAGPVLADVSGMAPLPQLGLALTQNAGSPGYAPLPLAALGAVLAWAVVVVLRRRTRQDTSPAALWQDGFAAPPAWLPFGDPLTQWNGVLFRAVTWPALPALPAWAGRLRGWLVRTGHRVSAPAVALGAIILLLALLAAGGAP